MGEWDLYPSLTTPAGNDTLLIRDVSATPPAPGSVKQVAVSDLLAGAGVNPMTTAGDTIFGGTAGVQTRLAGNTTATRKFLRQLGTGSASAAPAWDTLTAADLPAVPGSLIGLAPSGVTTGGTDRANIQGLLNLTGKAVLQAGLFFIDQTLTFGSNTGLYGAGQGVTTIRARNAFAPTQVGGNQGAVMLATTGNAAASHIQVRDLTLDGNETNNPTLPGFALQVECSPVGFQNVNGLVIDGVEVINAIGYSMFPVSCTRVQITNNVILSGQNATAYDQQDGIHVSDCTGVVIADNVVTTGTNGGDDPIVVQGLVTGCSEVTITGNTIPASGTHGIDLVLGGAAVTGVTVTGNTIANTQNEGVIFLYTTFVASATYLVSDVAISGNTFRNIGLGGNASGIALQDGSNAGHPGVPGWADIAIVANVFDGFSNPNGFGIFAPGGSNLQVMANTFNKWNAQIGIQIGNTNFGTTTVAETVNGFQVIGNTINMAGTAATGPTGIQVQDSLTGTIANNTVTGPGAAVAGGTGILIIDFEQASTGLAVTGNVFTGWALGVQETNDGAQPDFNAYTGNLWLSVTTPLSLLGSHNTVLDASRNTFPGPATFAGLASHNGGTDTSGGATASTPTFASGTAKQLSATRDVMLYIFCTTAVTSITTALGIGATSAASTAVVPSASMSIPVGAMWSVRVPKGWFVKFTGTVADFAFTQVTC